MTTTPDITTAQVLFEESYLRILFHADQNMVHLVWDGYAPSAAYRSGLDTALEFVLANGVERWLADLRHMGAILQADEKWTNETWFPQLAHGVLERMAILRSSDFFNQLSVDRIMARTEGVVGFEVGYFQQEEDAVAWLLGR